MVTIISSGKKKKNQKALGMKIEWILLELMAILANIILNKKGAF